MKLNKHLLFLFFCFFVIKLLTTQNYLWNADEGTHVLIGAFLRDLSKNIINFRSLDEILNFATNFVVKYPKLAPYYPPLYHLILAGILFLGNYVIILRIYGVIISLLTAFIIYKILLKLKYKEKTALLCSLIFLSFSSMFYYSDKVTMDVFQILTFTFGLLIYLDIKTKKNDIFIRLFSIPIEHTCI